MSALRDCQQRIVASVLQRPTSAIEVTGIVPAGDAARRRLAIYRVTARENFAAALEAAFPVLREALGAEEFRSLAWSYQLQQPSGSGNLFEVGRRLPTFLRDHLAGSPDEHLADLADLEWAVQEAMVAADSDACVDYQALSTIPATLQGSIRLHLHPSVRLVRADYRVFDAWQRHHTRGTHCSPDSRPHRDDPERLLVIRSGSGIEVYRLSAADHAYLECLAAGKTLDELATTAQRLGLGPDLGPTLARWTAAGVISAADCATSI
jgi:hypothetical protein